MDISKLSKLKQSAPEIPTNTCPYIDFIQDIIKEVIDECDSSFIEQKLELAISTLEYVRESNDALRKSSNYWYNKIK
jgi:hypothetical protein